MIFIHPMWDSENQRLGLMSCTPFGYTLNAVGSLIGFIGLLTLVVLPIYLIYQLYVGRFQSKIFYLLLIPLGIGIFGRVISEIGWMLARRKQFQYDFESRMARWNEAGEIHSYPPKREDA